MKILLLGVGMQGKAVLHDLHNSSGVTEITAADKDGDALKAYIEDRRYGARVRWERVDATEREDIDRVMERGFDVVIDLLPVAFHDGITEAAVRSGIPIVNASYASPKIRELGEEAAKKNIAILPECGMDPGLDLILLGEAIRSFDSVEEIVTYGAGFPEPRAADNPIRYKVTWSLEGVLRSYLRPARIIRSGRTVDIEERESFNAENIHEIEIEGLGRLEAFPNGVSAASILLISLVFPNVRGTRGSACASFSKSSGFGFGFLPVRSESLWA